MSLNIITFTLELLQIVISLLIAASLASLVLLISSIPRWAKPLISDFFPNIRNAFEFFASASQPTRPQMQTRQEFQNYLLTCESFQPQVHSEPKALRPGHQ